MGNPADAGPSKSSQGGGPGQRANPGGQPGSTNSGGSKKGKSAQRKGSVIREATWNNMTKGARMQNYGTTSYAKYKAGKKASNIKGTAKSNRQMRGTGK